MERLSEEFVSLEEAVSLPWMNVETAEKIKERMKVILAALGEKGFVHGDLRSPNVFVSKEGDVKVIDFDWSGLEDETFYPDVNYRALWPSGVGCGKQLKKAHDWCLYQLQCIVLDHVTGKL